MTNGLQARKEKIETITNKVEEVSKKVEIEEKAPEKTKVELATEIGKQNAIDGKSHAPAQSKELMDLIKDLPV